MLQYTHRPGGTAHCPECKEPISRLANICPHCRTDLTANQEWQEKKANSSGGCAGLVIFGIVCSGIVGLTLGGLIG